MSLNALHKSRLHTSTLFPFGGDKRRVRGAIAISGVLAVLPLVTMPGSQAFAGDDGPSAVIETAPPPGGAAHAPVLTAAPFDPPQQELGSTAEIPQAQPIRPPRTIVDTTTDPADAAADGAQSRNAANQAMQEYQAAQDPPPPPEFHSLQEFMSEGTATSPIGLELREDSRKLSTGERADGLLVLRVGHGSPAADAGLRGYSDTAHSVLEGAAVAATMVFPPAVLAIAVLDQTHVGESYDMIIGVDGKRVTNYLDFEDQMRDVKPGDIVYLSIVRDGKRRQVLVHVPTTASSAP